MNSRLADIWYPSPMECRFRVPWGDQTGAQHIGIAVRDTVVDLSDGTLYEIQDILYEAREASVSCDDAIVEWCEWRPLKELLE